MFRILIFGCIIILFSCSAEQENIKVPPKVIIRSEKDSLLQSITYFIDDSLEYIALEISKNKINSGVVRYRYRGNSGLRQQVNKLDTLLFTILKETDIPLTQLAWGRLSDHNNRDYTLAKRLSLLAFNSTLWDKNKGKPIKGHENAFVANHAKNFAPEIDTLLKKYNYKIVSISAEKVLISSADLLPFWNKIMGEVNGPDKLPWDCQLWFILKPVE
jgi:hypothetical protein